jgi:hypothetical protein
METKTRPAFLIAVLILLILGCLSSSPPPVMSQQGGEKEQEGVLESEDISVILQGGGLWMKITPMSDQILRYTNTDTHRTYRSMLESQGRSLYRDGEVAYQTFFVQFQGRSENEVYFDPTELNIIHQGKLYKPSEIIPISSTFNKRILKLYGNPEMAIYAFSREIDLDRSIEFKYKDLKSNQWDEIIRTVEEAKLRVR